MTAESVPRVAEGGQIDSRVLDFSGMAWLAKLDARAARWPKPAFWTYFLLKWYLVLLGGFALIRVNLDKIGVWPFFH